jgi:hypothetical protein
MTGPGREKHVRRLANLHQADRLGKQSGTQA